jgi:RNA polymerase sigma-70 factor (ECF subfamily)
MTLLQPTKPLEGKMHNATYALCQADSHIARDGMASHVNFEDLDSLSDESLIEKCRRNDRKAFDVFIKRYQRLIFSLAYRLAGNYEDAHDIAAEAFLRIFRSIGRFQHVITLRAWIKRIVVNVAYDSRRKAKRSAAVSLEALVEKTGDCVLNDKCKPEASPHEMAEANERKHILRKAITELPEHQRLMVMLFHWEGRSYEEIASMLNIPLGTVRSRMNRARLALRERLSPQMAVLTA